MYDWQFFSLTKHMGDLVPGRPAIQVTATLDNFPLGKSLGLSLPLVDYGHRFPPEVCEPF